jgi:hypothetical protein
MQRTFGGVNDDKDNDDDDDDDDEDDDSAPPPPVASATVVGAAVAARSFSRFTAVLATDASFIADAIFAAVAGATSFRVKSTPPPPGHRFKRLALSSGKGAFSPSKRQDWVRMARPRKSWQACQNMSNDSF